MQTEPGHPTGLDRPAIQRSDFPVKRRGYDPDAVAAHLAVLAEELEALRRTPHPVKAESVATAASGQVRSIIEAAERSAAAMEQEAGLARDRILEDARGEAREHLERVTQATASMLERADVLEQEFASLLELVRESATRLAGELQALQAAAQALMEERGSRAPEPEVTPPPSQPDDEGARLIALNMALNGTSREDTERYLADHFEAVDRDALLQDVYLRAGQ